MRALSFTVTLLSLLAGCAVETPTATVTLATYQGQDTPIGAQLFVGPASEASALRGALVDDLQASGSPGAASAWYAILVDGDDQRTLGLMVDERIADHAARAAAIAEAHGFETLPLADVPPAQSVVEPEGKAIGKECCRKVCNDAYPTVGTCWTECGTCPPGGTSTGGGGGVGGGITGGGGTGGGGSGCNCGDGPCKGCWDSPFGWICPPVPGLQFICSACDYGC